MTSTNFKKYRCRYFEQDGRPIPPTCNQGDACRFVHPNDPNWPGKSPFIDTRLSSGNKHHKDSGKTVPRNVSESRGPPLVPQSDLFLRRKASDDEQTTRTRQRDCDPRDRDRDAYRDREKHRAPDIRDSAGDTGRVHKAYPTNRSSSPARPYAKKYNRTASDSSKKSVNERNKGPSKHHSDPTLNEHGRNSESSVILKTEESMYPKDDFASPSAQNSRWAPAGQALIVPRTLPAQSLDINAPNSHSDEAKRAERLVGLFRSLASLSNEIVVATAAHEREGQKLQTYTEISSALSKISSAAASSVAPNLAEIMLRHEQCKHRVDESFKALGGVWEQVFDVFVSEVVRVIDSRLQDAMGTLKKEGEHAVEEFLANTGGSPKSGSEVPFDRKRTRTRGPAEPEDERAGRGLGGAAREYKRRRFGSRSPSPDPHDRPSSKGGSGDDSMQDILAQMKMKIDEQAHSLQILSKENSQLKNTLKQAGPLCSSFSTVTTLSKGGANMG